MQLCLWCTIVCIVWEWQRHGETPWVFTAAMTPVLIMASRITCRVWLGNSTPINNLNKLDTTISPNDSLHSPLDSRVLSFCPPKNCCSFCTLVLEAHFQAKLSLAELRLPHFSGYLVPRWPRWAIKNTPIPSHDTGWKRSPNPQKLNIIRHNLS